MSYLELSDSLHSEWSDLNEIQGSRKKEVETASVRLGSELASISSIMLKT